MNTSCKVRVTETITDHDRGSDRPKSKTQFENPIESRRRAEKKTQTQPVERTIETSAAHWPVRMPRGSCHAGAERRRMPRGSGQCRDSKGIGPLGRRARLDAPPEKGRQGVETGRGRTRCPSEGGNAAARRVPPPSITPRRPATGAARTRYDGRAAWLRWFRTLPGTWPPGSAAFRLSPRDVRIRRTVTAACPSRYP